MNKTIRNLIRLALGAVTVAALLPSTVQAQATLGPAIAYHDDFKMGIGVGLNVPIQEFGRGVAILSDFFYFFPDGSLSYLELNGNLTYSFALDQSPVTPFVLAGANVANTADDFTDTSRTEVGLNIGGGLYFGLGSIRPIVAAKIEIGGGRGFVVFGHLPFVIGR